MDAENELLTEALGALLSVLWRTGLVYCIKLMLQPECQTLFQTDTIALCSEVCNFFVGYMDAMMSSIKHCCFHTQNKRHAF